jgi:hypothetical protein
MRTRRRAHSTSEARPSPSRPARRSLGALFLVLTLLFAGIAVAAARADVWPVAIPAAVLSAWLATMAASALRPR